MNENLTVEDLFDRDGFVTDVAVWNRDLALSIAAQLGVEELSESHWQVIDELRRHYLDMGSLPWMTHLCRGLDLEDRCIHRLFGGPVEAWKIAGLPNPGEEARTYMENEEQ